MSLRPLFLLSSFIAFLASPSLHAVVQEDEDPCLTKGGKNALSPSSSSDEMLVPLEIRSYIFSFLTKQDDLLRAGAVSKHWREAAEYMWATRTLELPSIVREQDYTTLAQGIFSCISLQDKELEAKDVGPLLKALQGTITLKKLDLSSNKFGNKGAQALATMLTTNATLMQLDLGDNSISNVGAEALATALRTNTSLTQLSLGHNRIGPKGAQALATMLATNKTLMQLDLWSNSIGDEGKKALDDLKQRRSSLHIDY
jgi:hypothetical protein